MTLRETEISVIINTLTRYDSYSVVVQSLIFVESLQLFLNKPCFKLRISVLNYIIILCYSQLATIK